MGENLGQTEIDQWLSRELEDWEQTLEDLKIEVPAQTATMPDDDYAASLIMVRKMAMDGEAYFKKLKADTDAALKTFMIQVGVDRQVFGGISAKIANGENRNITEARIREVLSTELEFNPDQIQWFLEQVVKVTPYDYIDMRKVKEAKADVED